MPLDNWDVSNIRNMEEMFKNCHNYNQPLNNWNVKNVKNMKAIFCYAKSFNQDINKWDVSSCKNLWDEKKICVVCFQVQTH